MERITFALNLRMDTYHQYWDKWILPLDLLSILILDKLSMNVLFLYRYFL